MASGPLFGAIFGHFEPFWALLGSFFDPFFGHFGCGATTPSGSRPPKVGVKSGGESK